LFAAALALSLVWRILLALLLLAPLGVLLGLPFPTGLRVVANEAAALVPWAWGVNGFFTVIGTAVALMLGGIRLRRDSWVSVRYAEGLHSSQSSATHQRTDRQEIVDQKPADFQRSL
jgi:hypothetical protein